jgi:hypothetical protein
LINGLDGKVQFDVDTISSGGATTLRMEVPPDQLAFVLDVCKSFVSVWCLALGLACLVCVSSFGLRWKSVKKEQSKKKEELDASELCLQQTTTPESLVGRKQTDKMPISVTQMPLYSGLRFDGYGSIFRPSILDG